MATGKSSKSPSKNRKKRPPQRRKKTKKILLDKTKVRLLAGVIFLVCCVCIAVNVLTQSAGKNLSPKNVGKTVASATTQTASETSSSKTAASASKTENSPVKTANSSINKNNSKSNNSKSSTKTDNAVSKTEKLLAKTDSAVSKTEKLPAKTAISSPKKENSSLKSEKTALQPENSAPKTEKPPLNSGVLPGKTENSSLKNEGALAKNLTSSNPFSIPPAKNGATLVFIIDDAGLNVEFTKRYACLPFPLTIAVLPKLSHSKDCAYVVRSYGKELILHQPMQSLNHNLNPGPGKITVDMSFEQIHAIIRENLAEIGPGVKGLNNHEGSEVTEDVLRIGAVLDACLENHIYFLDSRTTANTKAPQAALERDMKIFEKSGPYIDNVVTREAMLEEIYRALEAANKKGSSIVIAHVDKSAGILPKLLEEIYPYLVKAGYRFATPSTLQ